MWKSEERQRLALASARIGNWEWDIADDRITYAESLALLYGRTEDRAFVDLADYLAVVHPDDRDNIRDGIGRALTLGVPYEAEYRLSWPDGSVHWLASRGTTIRSADGTPASMVGVNLDITDRKLSEIQIRLLNEGLERRARERTDDLVKATAALREREQRFRAIFDSAFQFIGLLAPDGTLPEVNRTALNFARVAREDVVGRPAWETPWWTRTEGASGRLRRALADACEGRIVRYEEDHRAPDGGVVTVDFSASPILGGE